jgi:hypothetical protein
MSKPGHSSLTARQVKKASRDAKRMKAAWATVRKRVRNNEGTWVILNLAISLYGFSQGTLWRWAARGCPWKSNGECLRTWQPGDTFNGRLLTYYLESELRAIKRSMEKRALVVSAPPERCAGEDRQGEAGPRAAYTNAKSRVLLLKEASAVLGIKPLTLRTKWKRYGLAKQHTRAKCNDGRFHRVLGFLESDLKARAALTQVPADRITCKEAGALLLMAAAAVRNWCHVDNPYTQKRIGYIEQPVWTNGQCQNTFLLLRSDVEAIHAVLVQEGPLLHVNEEGVWLTRRQAEKRYGQTEATIIGDRDAGHLHAKQERAHDKWIHRSKGKGWRWKYLDASLQKRYGEPRGPLPLAKGSTAKPSDTATGAHAGAGLPIASDQTANDKDPAEWPPNVAAHAHAASGQATDANGRVRDGAVPENQPGDEASPRDELSTTPGRPAKSPADNPWADQAISGKVACQMTGFTPSQLSKLCRPGGPVRYERRGRRLKVHAADLARYIEVRETANES